MNVCVNFVIATVKVLDVIIIPLYELKGNVMSGNCVDRYEIVFYSK